MTLWITSNGGEAALLTGLQSGSIPMIVKIADFVMLFPEQVARHYRDPIRLLIVRKRRQQMKQRQRAARRRKQKPIVFLPAAEAAQRNRAIFIARQRDGKTYQQIAEEHGLSKARIAQIVFDVEHKMKRTHLTLQPRAQLARIQDPDPSQREVWLSFTVPPDPRLDAMEPVRWQA